MISATEMLVRVRAFTPQVSTRGVAAGGLSVALLVMILVIAGFIGPVWLYLAAAGWLVAILFFITEIPTT